MNEKLAYRAYFLTVSDHIRHVIGFRSADDASAREHAERMLEQSDYAAIEIYEGWRLVLRQEKLQRAA